MDRKKLEERLALLTEQRDALVGQVKQLNANIQAFGGAIQDCQFWLAEMDKASTKEMAPGAPD